MGSEQREEGEEDVNGNQRWMMSNGQMWVTAPHSKSSKQHSSQPRQQPITFEGRVSPILILEYDPRDITECQILPPFLVELTPSSIFFYISISQRSLSNTCPTHFFKTFFGSYSKLKRINDTLPLKYIDV